MKNRQAFTLMELLIVVLIIGTLASIGVPQYMKTVAVSRITDGFGTMMMIGASQEMCKMDKRGIAGACPDEEYYRVGTPYLVANRYLANKNWRGTELHFGTGKVAGVPVLGAVSAHMQYKGSQFKKAVYFVTDNVCREVSSNDRGTPNCPK